MTSNSYPIFVDGAKFAEATALSYSVETPVHHTGIGKPGMPDVVEQDPPEYFIEAELPTSDIYAPIDTQSHVEFAIPPTDHDGSGWKVIEVWEIHQFEITGGSFELAAWQGKEVTGVDYLGFDTDAIVDGTKRVEPEPGIDLRIDTKHESDDAGTVLGEAEDEDESDFEADVHDI